MLFESTYWSCQAPAAEIILIIFSVSEKDRSSTLEERSIVKH